MNNLSSYCGLVDAKIRASDKDLPVQGLNLNAAPTEEDYYYNDEYDYDLEDLEFGEENFCHLFLTV